MPLPQSKERFTYQDYLQWSDDERWEIIDGIAYDMTPSPGVPHQDVVQNLIFLLRSHLEKGGPCRIFLSPLDVVLSDSDIVQPDVFMVCEPGKISRSHIQGAPDLIFEVLSPSTSLKDRREKKRLYKKYGVKEYILLDPIAHTAERFELKTNGLYGEGSLFGEKETLPIETISLEIEITDIFAGVER